MQIEYHKELNNRDFVEQIVGDIKNGSGIVPFIGSGCSSSSGILMGNQFDEYLAYTVYLCVEGDIVPSQAQRQRWNLRTEGWPPLANQMQLESAKKWLDNQFEIICKDYSEAVSAIRATNKNVPKILADALASPPKPQIVNSDRQFLNKDSIHKLLSIVGAKDLLRGKYHAPDKSPTSEAAIRERAIRSLFDWKSTLVFLSELKIVENQTLLLDDPDLAIIDSFNVHITNGRKPNLFHNMLCHLSGPARIRTILTTNFDSLIEDAFADMREKLSVISVSIKGDLPDPKIVHMRNTIVKMHGTMWETRADFSLDESPSLNSKHRFFHYVRGQYPGESIKPFLPNQILVCGYSGGDNRCMELIKYVLDADKNAKVYWVCYNQSSLEKLEKQFPERYDRQLIVTASERPDLLLYELYQRLCLGMPKGGSSYQYTHNIAPKEYSESVKHSGDSDKNNLTATAVKMIKSLEAKKITIVDGGAGVLADMCLVMDHFRKNRFNQVWLELEDYADVFCLANEIMQIISIRLGIFQLTHANLIPAHIVKGCMKKGQLNAVKLWEKHLESMLSSHLNIDPEKWVIALYGRNGPGGCAGWEESGYWNSDHYERIFEPFLTALNNCGFRTLYAPYSRSRSVRDEEKWTSAASKLKLKSKNIRIPIHDYSMFLRLIDGGVVKLKTQTSRFPDKLNKIKSKWLSKRSPWYKNELNTATDEAGKNKIRLKYFRFLYAATLFRQSRHYSAFLNDGTLRCPYRFNTKGFDNDWLRDVDLESCLKELNNGVFYEKPGGFAWLYRDYRLGIRALLEERAHRIAPNDISPMNDWRSFYHYWISDWYMKAFYTTGHAIPLMEAIYHLYQCIKFLDCFRENSGKNHNDKQFRRYKWLRIALCDMTKAFRIGRESIKKWFGAPQFKAWFEHPKMVIRTIETTIDHLFETGYGILPVDSESQIKEIVSSLREEIEDLNKYVEKSKFRVKGLPRFTLPHVEPRFNPEDFGRPTNDPKFWLGAPKCVTDLQKIVRSKFDKPILDDAVKDWRHTNLDIASNDYLFYTVQHLNEWTYVFSQRASFLQIAQLDRGSKSGTRIGLNKEVKILWLTVCVMASTAIESCRLLHPVMAQFEKNERAKALTLYAVGLGRLGRFYEAHRRLNEASSILTKTSEHSGPAHYGIIELRRAEVHILEAILISEISHGNPNSSIGSLDQAHLKQRYGIYSPHVEATERIDKLCVAKLDDAWRSLELATSLMAGNLYSPRWWCLLSMLKLRCILEEPLDSNFRLLAERIQNKPSERIMELFSEGIGCSAGNSMDRLILIDFALRSIVKVTPEGAISSEIQEIFIKALERTGSVKDEPGRYLLSSILSILDPSSKSGG